jgi:hypothetical protein
MWERSRSRPQPRLELSLAPAPAENDEVVQGENATVFLEDQLVALLDDKTLDTKIDGDQVSFTSCRPARRRDRRAWTGAQARSRPQGPQAFLRAPFVLLCDRVLAAADRA